jgi:hypothetical protein
MSHGEGWHPGFRHHYINQNDVVPRPDRQRQRPVSAPTTTEPFPEYQDPEPLAHHSPARLIQQRPEQHIDHSTNEDQDQQPHLHQSTEHTINQEASNPAERDVSRSQSASLEGVKGL